MGQLSQYYAEIDYAEVTNSHGQAMVEFVILLIVFMALASGMLFSSRLLTAQFWAQQEARYLAFEQEWVARKEYVDPQVQPALDLEDRERFLRPRVIEVMETERDVTDAGGSEMLMSHRQSDPGPLQVASNSWVPSWVRSLSRSPVSFVSTAYAREAISGAEMLNGADVPSPKRRESSPPIRPGRAALGDRIRAFFESVELGEEVCQAMSGAALRRGVDRLADRLGAAECPPWLEKRFAAHLAGRTDLRSLFREYDLALERGRDEAIRTVIGEVVAEGFYSFFDTEVRERYQDAVPFIQTERVDYAASFSDSSIDRMLGDLRYVGSAAALGKLIARALAVAGRNASNRNWVQEKAFEDGVTGILHAPVDDFEYLFNPTYLPVPPDLGPVAGALYTGFMEVSLSTEEHLLPTLVQQPNQRVEVRYDAGAGLFPAIRSRFNTANPFLWGRWFLVTQPWHIERRSNGTGGYRNLGDQYSASDGDAQDDEDEEARLRSRVQGWWLIPTPLESFSSPFLEASGLGDFAPLVNALAPLSGVLEAAKDFINNNPLNRVFAGVRDIPFVGAVVPILPLQPAVRPHAYPGSTEIEEDFSKEDEEGWKFETFLEEQRKFNPEPKPTFYE